jgi:hypothetical protein
MSMKNLGIMMLYGYVVWKSFSKNISEIESRKNSKVTLEGGPDLSFNSENLRHTVNLFSESII